MGAVLDCLVEDGMRGSLGWSVFWGPNVPGFLLAPGWFLAVFPWLGEDGWLSACTDFVKTRFSLPVFAFASKGALRSVCRHFRLPNMMGSLLKRNYKSR